MGNDDRLELRILGSLEVVADGEPRALRGPKQASLLALLVLHRGEVISSDRLIDGLWETPPPGAQNTLHVHVSQLRKLLGRDALVTRPAGYVLDVDPEAVDAVRFERLVSEGSGAREAGEPDRAAALLGGALGLWRGPALEDVRYEPFAQAEIARLEELRRAATEERIAAALDLGRHAEVIGELEGLVTEHPLREGLRGQLMVALYRSGRQADALEVYREGRRLLADELGLEPGPALQELERAILRQDTALAARPRARSGTDTAAAPPRELRKTVTVLAVELRLAGASLDPEARQAILGDALAAVAQVAERNGGMVHELAQERVTAVFGAPIAREDDAVRAVRAAVELAPALAQVDERLAARGVSVSAHAGLETGTVLTGASVAGEVVADAARLAQAAGAGEILAGPATRRLVGHAVAFEREAEAFRVAEVAEDAPATRRRLDTPLVGRRRELDELLGAFRRTAAESRPALVTVLGPAGIGKSRLVAELLELVEPEATILHGRCPSYGGGGSLGPVAQAIGQAARDATAGAILPLLGDDPDAATIAEQLAAALARDETASVSGEELSWAVRRLFRRLARERPLVLAFEDVHWGRSSFLDLVESLVDLSRGSPILVVCLARPELLDERPSWGGATGSISTLLQPLSGEESETLLRHLGGEALAPATRDRVIERAEGNPLFLEQLLAVLAEEGVSPAELDLPLTVEALIAARLDRLDSDERGLLEHAAIVGREFQRDATAALLDTDGGPALDRLLERLVRRELIVPAPDASGSGDVYRFHHMLVRETASKAMPKALRAVLHERFAAWLAPGRGPAGDLDELRGYHLEQAHLLLVEVEGPSERSRALGEQAAANLSTAGRRAYAQDDGPAAARLLARAASLMPADGLERLDLLVDLGEARRETGDFEGARLALAEAMERAEATGNRATGARARVVGLRIRMQTESEFASSDVLGEVEEAIAVLEEAGDERGLARAWTVRAWIPWLGCRAAEAAAALRPALELARRAGDTRTESYGVNLMLGVSLFGPTPVPEASALCENVLGRARERRRFAASAYRALAGLRAMEGRFDEARTLLERDREIIEDLGLRVHAAVAAEIGGMVELLADEPAAAEERLRAGYDVLVEMGERSGLSNLAPMLARALHAQGRDDEALEQAEAGQELAPGDDLSAQVQWRGARALVLAARGDHDEAARLAGEAAGLAAETDFLNLRGDALADLAEVLRRGGRFAEAAAATEQAIALYESKGNVAAAERTRAALAGLRP